MLVLCENSIVCQCILFLFVCLGCVPRFCGVCRSQIATVSFGGVCVLVAALDCHRQFFGWCRFVPVGIGTDCFSFREVFFPGRMSNSKDLPVHRIVVVVGLFLVRFWAFHGLSC